MGIVNWLNEFDTALFLALNGNNSLFFDSFFSFFTSKEVWYPLYFLLLLLFIRRYRLQAIPLIVILVIAIVLADQVSNLLKNGIGRFRPTHDPNLLNLVNNTFVGKGGLYGFVSGHAANSFALTIFVGKLLRNKWAWAIFIVWALLTSYSRIYVGVHYPFDVLAGGLIGGLIGWASYRLLMFADIRLFRKEISKNGPWQTRQVLPIILAICFITITLVVVARLMIKYNLLNA